MSKRGWVTIMPTNRLVAVVEEVQAMMHRSKGFEEQGEIPTETQKQWYQQPHKNYSLQK